MNPWPPPLRQGKTEAYQPQRSQSCKGTGRNQTSCKTQKPQQTLYHSLAAAGAEATGHRWNRIRRACEDISRRDLHTNQLIHLNHPPRGTSSIEDPAQLEQAKGNCEDHQQNQHSEHPAHPQTTSKEQSKHHNPNINTLHTLRSRRH